MCKKSMDTIYELTSGNRETKRKHFACNVMFELFLRHEFHNIITGTEEGLCHNDQNWLCGIADSLYIDQNWLCGISESCACQR